MCEREQGKIIISTTETNETTAVNNLKQEIPSISIWYHHIYKWIVEATVSFKYAPMWVNKSLNIIQAERAKRARLDGLWGLDPVLCTI